MLFSVYSPAFNDLKKKMLQKKAQKEAEMFGNYMQGEKDIRKIMQTTSLYGATYFVALAKISTLCSMMVFCMKRRINAVSLGGTSTGSRELTLNPFSPIKLLGMK
jgi:hypothetical protein